MEYCTISQQGQLKRLDLEVRDNDMANVFYQELFLNELWAGPMVYSEPDAVLDRIGWWLDRARSKLAF